MMKKQRGRGKFARLVDGYMALGLTHYAAYEAAREDDPAAYIRFIGGKASSAKEEGNNERVPA
jgi:hypothetical protein